MFSGASQATLILSSAICQRSVLRPIPKKTHTECLFNARSKTELPQEGPTAVFNDHRPYRGCWHKIFCLFVESSVLWLLIRERSKLLALSILGMYALLPPVLNHLQCIIIIT